MSARPRVLAVAALVIALFMIPAWASAGSMRYGVAGFFGYQTYSMSDVNNGLADANDQLATDGFTGSFDDIKHGVGFGGGLHAMNESWLASLEYTRLDASTSADITDTSSGTTVSSEFKVPANGVTAGAAYLFPSSHKARFGLGAGVGYYNTSGKFNAVDPSSGASTSEDVKGHAIGFHGIGMVDTPVSNVLHVELQAGYRYAKTSNFEVGGVQALNSDGSKAKIDWSGLMTRFGLTFYFGQSH